MFEKIIWATDGSDAADRALSYALKLAESNGSSVVAVHCNEHIIGGKAKGQPVLADEEELQAKIAHQVHELKEKGVDASLVVIDERSPGAAHSIADHAEKVKADVIVVGTRGHSTVAGLLVGSVTHRLLHIAPCPLIVVPEK